MTNKYIRNNGNGNFKVTVPFEINTYESWSVITQIVTPETFEDCTIVNNLNSDDEEIKSFKLDLNSAGHLVLSLSTDGTSYSSTLISAYRLEENNQLYYIRISWSGSAYTVEVSTNNTDWNLYIYHESSQVLYSNVLYVNFIPTIDLKYFKGKLDINSTELIKKTSSDADNVTIFSGSESTGTGYLNHGAYINNNIASSFNTDKYIICNGVELTNYVKIITRININNFVSNERQAIISNINRQGIFCKDGKLGLALSTDGNEILSTNSIIEVNKNYYIGYVFLLDNGIYKHKLYYMEDDGYYSDYTELPDFDAYCMKPWTEINTISNDNNIFKNTIYIGSNKVKYLSAGSTIDLNNTIISNNIVTYSISKPGLSSIEDQSIQCYVPELGTRILNSSDTVIDNISLTSMYKVTISAVEIESGTNIDLSYATVEYTVTNSNYGTNGTNYYKKTTSTDQGSSRVIYVLPGSNLTYRVTNLTGYHSYEHTISDINSDIIQQEQFRNFQGLKFTAKENNSIVSYNVVGTPTGSDIQYSYNGINWNPLDTVTLNNNEYIYVKGNNTNGLTTDSSNYVAFNINTGKINASGNINSLLDNDDGSQLLNNEIPNNYCYHMLFKDCTALITPPELPATTLTDYCYNNMFNGCTSMITTPVLPATTLTERCYQHMFANCTSLTQTPVLPSTSLNIGCYADMFRGCTSLTQVSTLPATTLANECYSGMFYECTSLVTPPELPATNIASICYQYMFFNCTSLTTAPELPATSLSSGCYKHMFDGCTSITEFSNLPATTLANDCYNNMFKDCTSLSYIKLLYEGTFNSTYFSNWVDNVSESGVIWYNGSDTTIGSSAIPSGWLTISKYETLAFLSKQNNSKVHYSISGSPTGSNLQYSLDKVNWTTWRTYSSNNITLNKNKVLYVRGYNQNGLSSGYSDYVKFTMSGKIESTGNINSLIDGDNYRNITTIPNNDCYHALFYECHALVTPPELPATNLKNFCYRWMFGYCSSLKVAPNLPATTLTNLCYENMFSGCSSLKVAPNLPATNMAYGCYEGMFQNCTSLTQAPVLHSTNLADYCYATMFKGCTSLVNAPALPATTMKQYCYLYMFQNCTSLTTAPELPATSLSQPATVYCYREMFRGCTNLNYIKIRYTGNFSSTFFPNWVQNVASIGNFYYNGNDRSNFGPSAIPTGWTVHTF